MVFFLINAILSPTFFVRVVCMEHNVYIALGTNLGHRIENLRSARSALPPDVEVNLVSSIYETPPWGFENQPAFLNQVLMGKTHLTPVALLAFLKNIEVSLGRRPTFRNGPRVIDLDILFYDNQVIEQPDLIIPHKRLHERAFVLVPLAEIALDYVHPVLDLSVEKMLMAMDRSGVEEFSG